MINIAPLFPMRFHICYWLFYYCESLCWWFFNNFYCWISYWFLEVCVYILDNSLLIFYFVSVILQLCPHLLSNSYRCLVTEILIYMFSSSALLLIVQVVASRFYWHSLVKLVGLTLPQFLLFSYSEGFGILLILCTPVPDFGFLLFVFVLNSHWCFFGILVSNSRWDR